MTQNWPSMLLAWLIEPLFNRIQTLTRQIFSGSLCSIQLTSLYCFASALSTLQVSYVPAKSSSVSAQTQVCNLYVNEVRCFSFLCHLNVDSVSPLSYHNAPDLLSFADGIFIIYCGIRNEVFIMLSVFKYVSAITVQGLIRQPSMCHR